ncbi:MAG: xanthine dehydrogenase molybdopterin binding subunit [Alphaproteobacteria bacterium]|nr:xanthine dehydrogenase molybdopterin binding subunit [Alphaproteobacteria bacterium]
MTSTIHTSRVHDSAHLHVTGAARYVDDLPTPRGTLVVVPGLSTIAAGRITTLGLEDVRHSNGVVAVLTAADIPGKNDVSPVFGDDPMLADGRVDYHGQIIYAVVATSVRAARAAMAKAVITYEARRPVLTITDALAQDSLLRAPWVVSNGDAAKAIAEAPHQLDGQITIGGQEHFYLEGHAALAIPDENNQVMVHVSSQHPTEIQHKVADVLGWAYHDVNVEVRRMGGGFGGKESQGNHTACLTALAATITGAPVKMVYDRDDDMKITGKRHDVIISYRAGYDDDGRIIGVEFEQALRCGMSFDLSYSIGERAVMHADNAYAIPHMTVVSKLCKTNTPSNTAFRGFGGPQGMMGIERVIDEIAHALGRDALDIRKINFYPDHGKGEPAATHYGQVVKDGVINDLVAKLESSSDYASRRQQITAWNAERPHLKRGLALTPVKFGISFNKTILNQGGALVHVYTDGSVMLNHGGTEMGQGLFTKVKQITASVFGIDPRQVRNTPTTTAKVPNTSATAASSGTDLNGMAAYNAATTIRDRMADHLAELHQMAAEDIVFEGGMVTLGGEAISFAEAANLCWQGRVSLSSTGFYATPDLTWDPQLGKGNPFFYYAYGAAATEVVVDMLTGEHRVLRVDILHDAGASLNPALDLGQIEGGYIQGLGWLTMEELVYGDDGRLLTHAPSTYKIPAASDRALIQHIDLYDGGGNLAETIYRSKAVGEPPFMLAMSAFFALSDALSSACPGYPGLNAPATAERLLMTAGAVTAS